MGLFDDLGQSQRQMSPIDMRQEIGSIKSDPAAYLSKRGLQIPAGMSDPKEITVHLLRTGQIGSAKLQQIMKMLGAR